MAEQYNCCLKPKVLESNLQQLDTQQSMGDRPVAWKLEQYTTPPLIAANVLTCVQTEHGDIQDKVVADLGCGCGVLAIGCVLLGARRVIGIDIDQRMIETARINADGLCDPDIIQFVDGDVLSLQAADKQWTGIDTVIMNPPFGTKLNEGIDRLFVEKALELSNTVYSLHKSSTRKYWRCKVAGELNCQVRPLMEVLFNIDCSFKFHQKESHDVNVDLLRFSRL